MLNLFSLFTQLIAMVLALFIIALIFFAFIDRAVGQTVPPQQFRYQIPPPALDIRPSYENPNPCKG